MSPTPPSTREPRRRARRRLLPLTLTGVLAAGAIALVLDLGGPAAGDPEAETPPVTLTDTAVQAQPDVSTVPVDPASVPVPADAVEEFAAVDPATESARLVPSEQDPEEVAAERSADLLALADPDSAATDRLETAIESHLRAASTGAGSTEATDSADAADALGEADHDTGKASVLDDLLEDSDTLQRELDERVDTTGGQP